MRSDFFMVWRDLMKFLLFFSVGAVILYLVYRNQNTAYQAQCALNGIPLESCNLINKILEDFRSVKIGYLALVMLFFNVSNLYRALRWKMMLESLGYKIRLGNAFFTIMLSYFANLGLPRVGEFIRATTFAKYEKVRVEKVVGTVVLDRLLDMVTVIIVVILAIVLEYKLIIGFFESQSPLPRTQSIIAASIWAVIIALIIWLTRSYWASWRIITRIQTLLLGFLSGIKSIKRISNPWLFTLHSAMIWLMYFLMTWVCFFAFEPTSHLSLNAGLVVFVFGTFGVVIPSPGGMGTFHALAVLALSFYAVSGDDAFSFANILFFTVQIGCTILLGVLSLILLPIYNKSYIPVRNTENNIAKP